MKISRNTGSPVPSQTKPSNRRSTSWNWFVVSIFQLQTVKWLLKTKPGKLYRKLYKNGKLLVQGNEKPADLEPQKDYSSIKDYGYLRLNQEMEAGEYILQLMVKDTLANKTVSQWIDFEVVN